MDWIQKFIGVTMYKCIRCNSHNELQYDEYTELYYCQDCHNYFTEDELEHDKTNVISVGANIILYVLLMVPILGFIVYLFVIGSDINHKQRCKVREVFLAVLILQAIFILFNLVWFKYYKTDLVSYTYDKLRYIATKDYIMRSHLHKLSIPDVQNLISSAVAEAKEVEQPKETVVNVDHNDLLDYDKFWFLDGATISGTRVEEILDSLADTQYACLVQTVDIRLARDENTYRNYGVVVSGSEFASERFNLYYVQRQDTYEVVRMEDGSMEYVPMTNLQTHRSIGWIRTAYDYTVTLMRNANGDVIGLMFTEIE